MTRAGAGAWGGSARNKELGYPAYKDDPEWQRLDAEYNRIRQERLSPSAEQAAREEYEAYMADVFPEGDAAAAERAELELLADADRDARREAERMGEYEQLEEPIKDGDKTGWNYVSFRDDNIRVDHKWV
ncbi:MAG: hypothetical protein IKO64_04500, partial [Kiritimatiellae bacterium]|nr:hypothetical protein [Kiritimatiellia bacterium]